MYPRNAPTAFRFLTQKKRSFAQGEGALAAASNTLHPNLLEIKADTQGPEKGAIVEIISRGVRVFEGPLVVH